MARKPSENFGRRECDRVIRHYPQQQTLGQPGKKIPADGDTLRRVERFMTIAGLHEWAKARNRNSRLGLQSVGELPLGPRKNPEGRRK
jgi:hypothetical protein